MFYAHPHVLCFYEIILRKTDFLRGLDKNEKNRYQNKPFRDAFFYLLCIGQEQCQF
jgi:hypothetical protein